MSCGFCHPLYPTGVGTSGNFVLSSLREEMGPGDVCWVPQAAIRHGRARQSQRWNRVGIVECSCGYRPRGVCIRENFILLGNWGTRLGVRQVAKRSSDPRVAYPDVKIQVRKLVRVVGIVAPFCPTRE